MAGMTIPPHLRRLFTSSPLLSLTLTTCCLIFLFTVFSPTTLPLFPDSWRADRSRHSYPPNIDIDVTPQISNSPLDLPDLHTRYAAFFPTLQLPTAFDTPLYRPLGERLHAFLARPGYEDSFRAKSDKFCPSGLSDQLVNPDQLNGEGQFWNDVSSEEVAKRRAEVVLGLSEHIQAGEEVIAGVGSGQGKGIVLTGGNQDTTLRMLSLLKQLKRLKISLPIEVFHYPGELQDDGQRKKIEELGAVIREIKGVSKGDGEWKSWQIKGVSIIQSSFREVLYLDSDNLPLRDPSHLFSAESYLTHGRAAFWPDLSKDHVSNAIWRIVGKPCSLESWTFESGQLLIDKAGNNGLNLAALLIAADMQRNRDFWFRVCGGDKDTYRWGFEILGLDYAESPRWFSAVGFENRFDGGRFCGHSMVQYDLVKPKGFTREPPLFVHGTLLKHIGQTGLSRGKVFTHIKRISDDRAHLSTLNHAKGYVYMAPVRGMCLDLEWHESRNDLPEEERERVQVELISVREEENDVWDGFEDHFFEDGGRVGGW